MLNGELNMPLQLRFFFSGAFSNVYKAVDLQTGDRVASKL